MYSFAGPAEVKGRYQTIRDWLQPVLVVIFLVTPWLKIGGQPVLLFDFINRHFVIFGTSFFSHDAPLLFFLVIILILSIFLTTAVFGRLWCGWSCPQTVFIHAVFNQVEKWIMGTFAKRSIQYREGGAGSNIRLFFLYFTFLMICWVLAHSFVAYFAGADVVTQSILEGPTRHLRAFAVLMIMTGLLFFNFVFFREKLCRSVCPYGRFQNTLIDTNTVVVFYNALRGEPRAKKSSHLAEKGDCVDCNRCVSVCPVKIDIRQGFQQECIACAKCIDACDAVMLKTDRQPSLIRYETGDQRKITYKRFRLVLYAGLMIIFTGAFIWSIGVRSDIDFGITRSSSQPFEVREEQGRKVIQNQLKLHLKNQTARKVEVSVELSEKNRIDGFRISSALAGFSLSSEQDIKTPAFIEINEADMKTADMHIEVVLKYGDAKILRAIDFVGVR
jgi:cytochrome c oxidase accessory protein FixG